ncbi:hypothetical protein ACFSL4_26620 [Streptomyces caeni]|uniref:Uncharacterized protein n=1 Tax=Streptomyces caeni TaxID=2307231 RepID=A0ABW4IYS6_9ACTN
MRIARQREPGARHRHGAGPRAFMTHLAVCEATGDRTSTGWSPLADPDDTTA